MTGSTTVLSGATKALRSKTLGIDLASADQRTGAAVVEWTGDGGRLIHLAQPASDGLIAELAIGCDVIAIDAPLGWPVAFTDALIAHRAHLAWPPVDTAELRLRRTDRMLGASGVWPLSVSTDRIGIVAFRAARLLPRLGKGSEPARDGSDAVIEVYPAAALRVWQQRHREYKRTSSEHLRGRQEIAAWIQTAFAIDLGEEEVRLVASSDLLDALICAVLAREWLLGRTEPLGDGDREAALEEGWIHLPRM